MGTVRLLKGAWGLAMPPVLVVGMVALALYLLGMVPAHFQSSIGGPREYDSIEDAEAVLRFDIIVPSYFPSYLSWPPVKIQGQLEPVAMAQTVFNSSDRHSQVLLINQVASEADDLPLVLPWVKDILQEMPVMINGNDGMLIVGKAADDRTINGVSWQSDGFHFIIVTTQPVQELMNLARSMHF